LEIYRFSQQKYVQNYRDDFFLFSKYPNVLIATFLFSKFKETVIVKLLFFKKIKECKDEAPSIAIIRYLGWHLPI